MKAQPRRRSATDRLVRAAAACAAVVLAQAGSAALAQPVSSEALLEPGAGRGELLRGDADQARQLAQIGRELFRGERAWTHDPMLVRGVVLPREQAACGRCHAAQAGAGAAAGPALGRLRSQSEVEVFVRAVEQGLAGAGRVLALPMPRYSLTDAERQALVAYLQVLGTLDDPAIVELLASPSVPRSPDVAAVSRRADAQALEPQAR